MNTLAKNTLTAIFGASIIALSLAAVNPAHARSGGGFGAPTVKFMMKTGSKFSINTMQEAKERQRQLATDPSVTSDSRKAVVREHDLAPGGTGIVRRRTLPN